MLSETELLHVLALQRVPYLGDILVKKLIHRIGSAEGVFKEKRSHLMKIEGIGQLRLKKLDIDSHLPWAEEELRYLLNNRIVYRYFLDKNYPERLKHCMDGPVIFFQKGNIDLQGKKLISVVGTRKATVHGVDFCEKLLEDLAPLNPVIVSGFAYGIDIAAQRRANELGLQTIGCLAHGFNEMYPKTHKRFVNGILENGGFITEFWSSDTFDRKNFLKRNRIIAGLSEATIVIESAEKGGSLVTADIAQSYNREVFAVPGRVTDAQSKGCNDLIKSQRAHLLSSAADLIYMLGWKLEVSHGPKQAQLFVSLTEEEKKIGQVLMEKDKALLDIIALESGFPVHQVASILLSLELKGKVRPLPGKMYQWLQ